MLHVARLLVEGLYANRLYVGGLLLVGVLLFALGVLILLELDTCYQGIADVINLAITT
jgi:hypothetical protein